jgi:ubiquinone/menaquinone biosynthesis C-methylase UbiE
MACILDRNNNWLSIPSKAISMKEVESVSSPSNILYHNKECKVNRTNTLVAFITSKEEKEKKCNALIEKERVRLWSKVYDCSYSKSAEELDPDFNTGIWTSNYSGKPVPKEQMKEWVSNTVKRILEINETPFKKPSILEIGCGTGLLLYALLPHVESYVGTDISEEAIDLIQQNCIGKKDASKIHLFVADADDLSGLPDQQYDIIVINSVIQYFPSADYLLSVIKGLQSFLSPNGSIFIGDVLCFPLSHAFYYETQFAKAKPDITVEELKGNISRLILTKTSETLYDPRLFHLLPKKFPWISSVKTQLRKGEFYNEMNNFRYDVILKQKPDIAIQTGHITYLDWEKDALSLEKLQLILTSNSAPGIHIANVPNARTIKSKKLMERLATSDPQETVEQLSIQLDEEISADAGIHPSACWALENDDYSIEVDWNYQQWDGKMSIRCIKRNAVPFTYPLNNFSIADCSNRPAISVNEWNMQEFKTNLPQKFPADRHPEEIFIISPEMYSLFKE